MLAAVRPFALSIYIRDRTIPLQACCARSRAIRPATMSRDSNTTDVSVIVRGTVSGAVILLLLGTLLFGNYLLWIDYMYAGVWAFLLAQALHSFRKRKYCKWCCCWNHATSPSSVHCSTG